MARFLCPVVVGRQRELARLDALLDGAQRGRGGVVFVAGAAGMGKSRLVAETAAAATARRMTVLHGRCVPSQVPAPYRPVAEALLAIPLPPALRDDPELSGFRAALGWIVPAWREGDAAVAAESATVVAEALLRTLQAMSPRAGCTLLVEDLHWADPETLHAVEYLADHAARTRVVCVCTLRDDSPSPATELVGRLDARRGAEVIALAPLQAAEVEEMAARSLDAATIAPEIADFLRDNAEGTPFLVEELLAAAQAAGALVAAGDGWTLSGPIGRLVPQSFATSICARLDGLDEAARRLVGAAALLGRSFDWRLAMRAAGCTLEEAREALAQALAVQLLVAGDEYGFRHALTRDAILDTLPPADRNELAARCLDALSDAHPLDDDWRHLAADLAEAAGAPDIAATHLLQAGVASLRHGALGTATAALERAAALAADPATHAEVLEALAEARSGMGDMRSTAATFETLLDMLARIDAPAARRGHAHLLLARCAVTAARFDVAAAELGAAQRLSDAGSDPALTARVGAVAAHLAIGEQRIAEAEALAVRAADDAARVGLADVVCEALEVAARCARTRDIDEAEQSAERMLRAAEDAGLALWRMRALYQLGVARMFRTGEVETLGRARQAAERLGAVATMTSLDLEIAAGLEAQHRLDESRQTCMRCIEMARALELHILEAMAHLFIAIIEGEQGARARMEESIGRSLAIGCDQPELEAGIWGDARAVASLAAEDRARARSELEQSAAAFGTAPMVVPRISAALRLLMVALDGGDLDLSTATGVTSVNGQCAGYIAFARSVHAGRRGRRGDAVEYARQGAQHLANLPWYRNLCRRLVAEAAIEDGWGEPAAWLTEAAAYFDSTGNGRLASACRTLLRRTGTRVARPTRAASALPESLRRAGVTPRESEVLALVGQGLSNRAIADALFLSERTVEQHVGALKQKLAQRTRAQLAVYAAGEGALAG